MFSVKLPLAAVWRLFDVAKVNTEFVLYWEHASSPNLTVAERYILDVASGHRGSVNASRRFWSFSEDVMEQVSTLLVDAQEDAGLAVTTAWLCFDPELRRPTAAELAARARITPAVVDAMLLSGPHFVGRRKGATDEA